MVEVTLNRLQDILMSFTLCKAASGTRFFDVLREARMDAHNHVTKKVQDFVLKALLGASRSMSKVFTHTYALTVCSCMQLIVTASDACADDGKKGPGCRTLSIVITTQLLELQTKHQDVQNRMERKIM